jgi:hypothetical protein
MVENEFEKTWREEGYFEVLSRPETVEPNTLQ